MRKIIIQSPVLDSVLDSSKALYMIENVDEIIQREVVRRLLVYVSSICSSNVLTFLSFRHEKK